MRKFAAVIIGALALIPLSEVAGATSTDSQVSGGTTAPVITIEDLNEANVRPFSDPQMRNPDAENLPQPGGSGKYSVVEEFTHWGSYTGMLTGKNPQASLSYQNNQCTAEIYNPQWMHIQFVDGQVGWIEHGIAHYCGSTYFYGFAAKNFDYSGNTPTGTLQGGIWTYFDPINIGEYNQGTNLFYSYRAGDAGASCAWWGQNVNNAARASVNFGACGVGTVWQVGLESYRNWATFSGPAALSTHNQANVWNGVPHSYKPLTAPTTWDSARVDYQMHGMWWGYPYPDWHCAKQNVAISVGSC